MLSLRKLSRNLIPKHHTESQIKSDDLRKAAEQLRQLREQWEDRQQRKAEQGVEQHTTR